MRDLKWQDHFYFQKAGQPVDEGGTRKRTEVRAFR